MITRFTGMAINVSFFVVHARVFANPIVDSCPKKPMMILVK
jgi:hypothetical protein